MGRETFTRAAYSSALSAYKPTRGPATRLAEQTAHRTGKLNPLVDPAEFGVIRRSLMRMEERPDGLWEATVGTSMPVETRVDTTGSMGGNVDVALDVLPKAFELFGQVLPGYDLHVATGIFGDVVDRFVLCRPQFEMVADKIVEQLTLMVPERGGGDGDEDPHYGLFGAAYLVDAYINRIGLKSYDFTVSDAGCHDRLSIDQLKRIFGKEVLERVAENGHQLKGSDLPDAQGIVNDLLQRAHAFFLQVDNDYSTTAYWSRVFGENRVVVLPSTQILPQVQAVIIGLTEGTLSLNDVTPFLTRNNVSDEDAKQVVDSVSNIPIGAQAALPNYGKQPQKGDLFREKLDAWPIDADEVPVTPSSPVIEDGPGWL